jgi:hypothetical protein
MLGPISQKYQRAQLMHQSKAYFLMRFMAYRRFSVILFALFLAAATSSVCLAMISIGSLTKVKAKEKYGITMHARQNGDACIMVWLEFKKKGWLEKFTYAELEMTDEKGKHLISAKLQPNPIHHRQAEDLTTVSFSADPSQLPRCRFLVVCYGSNEGDVGYTLDVKDFLDMTNPITVK